MDIIFATLSPANLDARENIHKAWSTAPQHHRSFFGSSESGRPHYCLRLGQGHRRTTGWVIGSGSWHTGSPTHQVDLLLAADPCVNPWHAVIDFDRDGRLRIYPGYDGIEVNGLPVPKGLSNSLKHHDCLKIGSLSYQFMSTVLRSDEDDFQRCKKHYMASARGRTQSPCRLTSASTTENELRIGPWLIHGAADTNTSPAIQAASNRTSGRIMAVKSIVRRSLEDAANANREIDTYRALESLRWRPGGQNLVRMHQVLYPSRQTWSGQADLVYMLWQPLARYTFVEFGHSRPRARVPLRIKEKLFVQVVAGIDALHEDGWIHRDIEPGNLFVVSLEPPHAVVGDFELAKRPGLHGVTEGVGAHGFAAPEVYNTDFGARYGYPADVFSLGAVASYLFLNDGKLPWSSSSPNLFLNPDSGRYGRYHKFWKSLRNLKPGKSSLQHLVYHMIHPLAQKRYSVDKVMHHDAFRGHFAEIGAVRPARQARV